MESTLEQLGKGLPSIYGSWSESNIFVLTTCVDPRYRNLWLHVHFKQNSSLSLLPTILVSSRFSVIGYIDPDEMAKQWEALKASSLRFFNSVNMLEKVIDDYIICHRTLLERSGAKMWPVTFKEMLQPNVLALADRIMSVLLRVDQAGVREARESFLPVIAYVMKMSQRFSADLQQWKGREAKLVLRRGKTSLPFTFEYFSENEVYVKYLSHAAHGGLNKLSLMIELVSLKLMMKVKPIKKENGPEKDDFKKAIAIAQRCVGEPHLMQIEHPFEFRDQGVLKLSFYTPYCSGGTIGQYLDQYPQLDSCIRYFLMFEMAQALYRFHALGYVHSDIGANNFILSSFEDCCVILVDYGDASLVTEFVDVDAGCLENYAPERIIYLMKRNQKVPEMELERIARQVGQKADVWSLALLYYEMVFKKQVPWWKDLNAIRASENEDENTHLFSAYMKIVNFEEESKNTYQEGTLEHFICCRMMSLNSNNRPESKEVRKVMKSYGKR